MQINGGVRPYNYNNYNCDPAGLGLPISPFCPGYLEPDRFECQSRPNNHSKKDEGFTASKAASSFFSGITEPFVQMLKNPVQTLGIAAGLGYTLKKLPGIGKYVAALGLAVGGLQFLTGFGKAASGIADGNSQQAEEGFKSMGTGTVSTVLSAFGIRGSIASKEQTGVSFWKRFNPFKNKNTEQTPTNPAPEVNTEAGQTKTAGIVTRITNFFKNFGKAEDGSTLSREQIIDKLALPTNEIPGVLANGAKYQVPFATSLYGSNHASKEIEGYSHKSSEDNGEPMIMQEADRMYKKF